MELAKIEIDTLGGSPVARHNMPCAVCGVRNAVLIMHIGRFDPCWDCHAKGYRLGVVPKWIRWFWDGWVK